jgi:hypothetical protein
MWHTLYMAWGDTMPLGGRHFVRSRDSLLRMEILPRSYGW